MSFWCFGRGFWRIKVKWRGRGRGGRRRRRGFIYICKKGKKSFREGKGEWVTVGKWSGGFFRKKIRKGGGFLKGVEGPRGQRQERCF